MAIKSTSGETLCLSCDIEVFKMCPFVYGEGRMKGLKTVPVLIKCYKGYDSTEMVIECPRYKKEVRREI